VHPEKMIILPFLLKTAVLLLNYYNEKIFSSGHLAHCAFPRNRLFPDHAKQYFKRRADGTRDG